MNAAAKLFNAPVESWRWFDLPVGPQPLPDWLRGLHVEWWDDFGHWPGIKLKTACNARDWEGKEYVKEGEFYRAFHDDGRMEQYAHEGKLAFDKEFNAWTTTQQEGFGGAHYRLKMKGANGPSFSFLGGVRASRATLG